MDTQRTRHARNLFAGIAPRYERMGAALSLGQDPRWRRFLVSKVNAVPGSLVLDVASGTGLVARELVARRNVDVVALDPSEPMLRVGVEATRAAGMQQRISAVLGRAERLPFDDAMFDSVTFTYLLRYVDDPAATLGELARVLRPGGTLASLEFGVPERPAANAAWTLYTRTVLPVAGGVVSPAWRHTGAFLGPSIASFARHYPLPVQVRMWQEAGIGHVRTRGLTFGAGLVTWGVRKGRPRG
ncbi:MAG: class I SAM-dependent methyltransferase [Actinomycetota bacterium]